MELPQYVDPIECLQQQRAFEGSLNSDRLPRLSEELGEGGLMIPYKLTFVQDEGGRCIVQCEITTCLTVICQRCGGSMKLPLKIASQLCVITKSEMEKALPKCYEPLVAQEEGMISLLDLIEEELLLAIPMIPRHDIMECPVNLSNDLLN